MKKWVVEIEKESGRVETRLVPARNKCTAISNCKNEGDTVLSCVPYTGQNVKVSGQRDEEEERGYGGYQSNRHGEGLVKISDWQGTIRGRPGSRYLQGGMPSGVFRISI